MAKRNSIIGTIAIVLVLVLCVGMIGSLFSSSKEAESGKDGVNGVGIVNIAKTSTVGLKDTYTIYNTNGNTSTFTITNGAKGDNGTDLHLNNYIHTSDYFGLGASASSNTLIFDGEALVDLYEFNTALLARKDYIVNISMIMRTDENFCQFPLSLSMYDDQMVFIYTGVFPGLIADSNDSATMTLDCVTGRLIFNGNNLEYCSHLAELFAMSEICLYVMFYDIA